MQVLRIYSMTDEVQNRDDELQIFRETFSHRLNHLLDIRGYPKKNFGRNSRLATELETRPSNVFKMLSGQIPQLPLLKKLVKLLHTTSDYLYGFSDQLDAIDEEEK